MLNSFSSSVLLILVFSKIKIFSPASVLKQYEQPVEQKELDLQVISNASRTVPEGGEMLQEGGLGSTGASVASAVVGSTSGIGKV